MHETHFSPISTEEENIVFQTPQHTVSLRFEKGEEDGPKKIFVDGVDTTFKLGNIEKFGECYFNDQKTFPTSSFNSIHEFLREIGWWAPKFRVKFWRKRWNILNLHYFDKVGPWNMWF